MKTTVYCIWMIFLTSFCFGQAHIDHKHHKILEEVTGDLNKDGIDEKVIVFDTKDTTDFGTIREIQILRLKNNEWTIWQKSRNAILKSGEGGMMGDPYGNIEINNGILHISHYGGSSWKWGYIDKYRYQNDNFELIGHTSNYGRPCDYWSKFDYNLSTGKIIYTKEIDHCEDQNEVQQDLNANESETFFNKGISINLNNRHTEEIKIVSPKLKLELYL